MKASWSWLLVAVVLCATNSLVLGIAIDGSRSDWDSSGLLHADAIGDHQWLAPGALADISKWGVTAEGGYLYTFIEDANMSTFMASGNHVFGAVLCDVDRTGGFTSWGVLPGSSKTGWNGPSMLGMRPSYGYNEFSYPAPQGGIGDGYGNFDGADAFIEWGPNDEGFNFWGAYDNMYNQASAVSNGSTAAGSNFMEHRVSINEIKSEIANTSLYYDAVTPAKVWKCAVRLAANVSGSSSWEGDKSGSAYDPSDATYMVWTYVPVETVMGDANEDGAVNFSDYLALSQNFGASGRTTDWSMGEFNADMVVNFSDYLILSQNFGSAFGASVPEPATMSLILLGGLALLRRKSA